MTRFFALHVGVVPLVFGLLLLAHGSLRRRYGVAVAEGARGKPGERYFPNQMLRDIAFVVLVLGSVALLTAWTHGAPLTAPVDTARFYPARPEWFHRFLNKLLSLLPPSFERAYPQYVEAGADGYVAGVLAGKPATQVGTDQPIVVRTPNGMATSASNFEVTTTPVEHARDVSLALRGHLRATGVVSSDLAACESHVTVTIQRKRHGNWRNVGSDETNNNGRFRASLNDRAGRYRALAPEVTVGTDVCLQDTSPRQRHRH
jgi:hypothetical protein